MSKEKIASNYAEKSPSDVPQYLLVTHSVDTGTQLEQLTREQLVERLSLHNYTVLQRIPEIDPNSGDWEPSEADEYSGAVKVRPNRDDEETFCLIFKAEVSLPSIRRHVDIGI